MVKNGYIPETLDACLKILAEENVTLYGGGTDLMVPEETEQNFVFLHRIPELKKLTMDEKYLHVGACVTFSEIEESKIVPTVFRECMTHLAGPAIRNIGTMAGNIANGSSKADSVLLLYVTDALVRVASRNGERIVPIDALYQKETALRKEEMIVEILIPNRNYENYYYQKIGPRKALAISRIDFCCIAEIKDDYVVNFAAAFGAIMRTVIRNKELDQIFVGLSVEEAKRRRNDYLKAYDAFLQPKSGRVSKEYRKQVSMNLLEEALHTLF